MARKSHPSTQRPGISGLTRICASCKEPAENATMHEKLKVWLCQACTERLKATVRNNKIDARREAESDRELDYMRRKNKRGF